MPAKNAFVVLAYQNPCSKMSEMSILNLEYADVKTDAISGEMKTSVTLKS